MTRDRFRPYAVIATIGLLVVTGILLFADRQPHIWILPPLVLTGMLLTVFALSDRRSEDRAARTAVDALGLRDIGVQPLPPLTELLAGAEPARLLAGHLEDGTPVRVGSARAGRGRLLTVAATEIVRPERIAADPHGVVGAETTAGDPALTWIRDHPLGLGLVAEGGTLVVAAPTARGEEPPLALLLEAAREARAKLA